MLEAPLLVDILYKMLEPRIEAGDWLAVFQMFMNGEARSAGGGVQRVLGCGGSDTQECYAASLLTGPSGQTGEAAVCVGRRVGAAPLVV